MKVFINNSYSTSGSSEAEEVNGFSCTLKDVSMSVSACWSGLQISYLIFEADKCDITADWMSHQLTC